MKLDEFKAGLKRLSANMAKAIPIENVEILYNELSWVPDKAWPDLVNVALETWDTWPRNFPKAIKALWFNWRKEKAAEFQEENCPYCQNEGYLEFYIDEYRYVCRCGHCGNWKRALSIHGKRKALSEAIPRWTKEIIKEKGYQLLCCNFSPYCECKDKAISYEQ